MAVGVGGLVAGLMGGDPTQQIANALAGPRPNPNPQDYTASVPSPTGAPGQGQPAPGMNSPPQQPPLPPAQAYAPDPANASTIALLLHASQQEAAANSINSGLQQISAGFGTAQQQHDKMQALSGMPQGGGEILGQLGQITKLQEDQFKFQEEQRFKASAGVLGQAFGFTPEVAAAMSSDPVLFNSAIGQKMRDASPTELKKNIDNYINMEHAAGTPEAQIMSTVRSAYAGAMMPNQTTEEKNMNNEILQWQRDHPNGTRDQMIAENPRLAGPSAYAEDQKIGVVAGKDRLAAAQSLPSIQASIKPVKDNLDQFFGPDGKVKPDVIAAIQTPDPDPTGTTGSMAGWLARNTGYGQGVLDQKNKLGQLQNQLSADVMRNVKNVRNIQEFKALGGSATAAMAKVELCRSDPKRAKPVARQARAGGSQCDCCRRWPGAG